MNSTSLNASEKKQSIRHMKAKEAENFFLKSNSYCKFNLPTYFSFDEIINKIANELRTGNITRHIMKKQPPRKYDNVNYTILNNKDGQYAWRPFQLIHPVLYVSLVHKITEESNWKIILSRFDEFSENEKIICAGLPSDYKKEEHQKDTQLQVLSWWHEVEQKSIELGLDYDYLTKTDITDFDS